MNFIDNLCSGAKTAYYFISTQVRAHKVDICLGLGIGLTAAAVCDAYVSAKKLAKMEVDGEESDAITKAKTIVRPLLLEGAGVYCVLRAVNIIKDEKELLSAALTTALATQQKLIDRTSETFGEESSEMIQLNKHSYIGDDANEKIDIANDYLLVISPDTVDANSPLMAHMQSKLLLVDTIKMIQTSLECDLKLKGYVFYSDVYERLGLDPTPISRLVGWCLPDEKHLLPGDENRAGYISFGLEELYDAIKTNDYDQKLEVIINPNLDGGIWDVYHKYNRNVVFGSWES